MSARLGRYGVRRGLERRESRFDSRNVQLISQADENKLGPDAVRRGFYRPPFPDHLDRDLLFVLIDGKPLGTHDTKVLTYERSGEVLGMDLFGQNLRVALVQRIVMFVGQIDTVSQVWREQGI